MAALTEAVAKEGLGKLSGGGGVGGIFLRPDGSRSSSCPRPTRWCTAAVPSRRS